MPPPSYPATYRALTLTPENKRKNVAALPAEKWKGTKYKQKKRGMRTVSVVNEEGGKKSMD